MFHRTTQLVLLLLASSVCGQDDALESSPTWHGDIEAIIRANCGACHTADSVGPFPLTSYNDVKRRAQFVGHVVDAGLMPPWLPSGGVAFVGDRRMSADDRQRLLAWVKAGAPEGTVSRTSTQENVAAKGEDLESAPSVRRASMRAPWTVPAEGGTRWFAAERDKRTFIMPLNNEMPLRVQSVEYKTTAPLALAATALAIDTTGNAREIVDWDDEPGSYMMGDFGFTAAGTLGVLGPGGGSIVFPKGYHIQIPANADLVSEVHFRPQGRAWELNDTVQLEEVPSGDHSRQLVALNLMVRKVELKAGSTSTFQQAMNVPMDLDLVAITPRASRRCVSMQLSAQLPGRDDATVLLEVADWNPHYRSTLTLKKPKRLPAGTRLKARWNYDNSAENTRNPVVPPEDISLGARCGMANVLLLCAPVDSERVTELERYAQSQIRKAQR